MCKAVENYANELAEERIIEEAVKTVKNLVNNGINIEIALKCSNIDHQTYEKYSKNLQ